MFDTVFDFLVVSNISFLSLFASGMSNDLCPLVVMMIFQSELSSLFGFQVVDHADFFNLDVDQISGTRLDQNRRATPIVLLHATADSFRNN